MGPAPESGQPDERKNQKDIRGFVHGATLTALAGDGKMTQIPIKRALERVPGGMMVIPLLCGSLLATFAPGAPKFFGSFTGALFSGALPILAVFFVCTGASIEFKATPYILRKGGALLAVKLSIGVLLGVIFGRLLGETPVSGGVFAGISTRDVGAYSVMSLESGAFFTMVTLGIAGSRFPWETMVGAILPLLVGMLLGNLDREMREFLSRPIPVLIPFFAFALGANLNLGNVWQAGLLGLGMGLAVVIVTGIPLYFADRLTGGNGVAGVAAASTAGNAVAVPAIVAGANPAYAGAANQATMLVAACVVVTAIVVPLVTTWTARRVVARSA